MSAMANAFADNIGDDTVLPMGVVPGQLIDKPPEVVNEPPPYTGPRACIVLEDNENIPPTGLFIGHNGRGFILRSGEKAMVPEELLNVLNDAVWSAPIVDEATRQIIGYRKRLRFPYRFADPNEP